MKKIKFFTTHALAIIVSVFATSAYFLLFELPDVIFYEHNEPKYIKLPTEDEKVHYHEISEQFYKGNLYLHSFYTIHCHSSSRGS